MRPSTAALLRLTRELVERAAALGIPFALGSLLLAPDLLFGVLRQAVRDVLSDVEPGDFVAVQQEHRVALLLAEDRDQHVGHADLAPAAGLHLEHGPLQHALEAQRRLDLAVVFALLHVRRGFVDVPPQFIGQAADVGAARLAGSRARAARR